MVQVFISSCIWLYSVSVGVLTHLKIFTIVLSNRSSRTQEIDTRYACAEEYLMFCVAHLHLPFSLSNSDMPGMGRTDAGPIFYLSIHYCCITIDPNLFSCSVTILLYGWHQYVSGCPWHCNTFSVH